MARQAKKKKGSRRDHWRLRAISNSKKKRSYDRRHFLSVEQYFDFKRSMHRGHNED